ncbi:MAG: BA14K family protein [Mesorhizobium sp.]|nr:BA14K family protein [Mesorhizobium sp.]
MKRALAIFCAAAVTVTSLGATATTAAATSLAMPLGQAAEAQLQEVQYRGNPRQRTQQRTQQRRGFYRQNNRGYYNGHRGYSQRRAGYRQHNGYWFPPAAFVMGAIIGGAIANQPQAARPGRLSQAHVNWCQGRYVSYRLPDNSFQPYNGPRRACSSPYG